MTSEQKFKIVKRPATPHRGGRVTLATTKAVLKTLDTGKAINFPDEPTARSARMAATYHLRKAGRTDLIARRSIFAVWVEERPTAAARKRA